jgi:hypothetical protein
MVTFKKKQLEETVGGDIFSDGGDRNTVGNTEIETGPVDKPYNNYSDYEKGVSVTTDRALSRYGQDIPWFAVYNFGGSIASTMVRENSRIIKKNIVEDKIDDLVKKNKSNGILQKGVNLKVSKILDSISTTNFTDEEIEELKKALVDKKAVDQKTLNNE